MRKIKKSIVVLFVVMLVFVATGCDNFLVDLSLNSNNKLDGGEITDIKIKPSIQEIKEMASKHYKMSKEQQRVYDHIYNGIMNSQKSILLDGTMDSKQIAEIFYIVKYTAYLSANFPTEYIMYTGVDDKVVQIDFPYPLGINEGRSNQEKLEVKVNEIVKQINQQENDFDKIKYIHDLIISNCIYKEDATENNEDVNYFTAYGTLVEGKAVCEGYAKAFSLLCNKVGINSFCVVGDAGGSHMWNMVECDGEWYNIDTTWDDPLPDENKISYSYFNVTDELLEKTHTAGDNITLIRPKANATKNNYYVKKSLIASDYEQAKSILSREAVSVLKQGGKEIQIKLINQKVLNDTLEGFFKNQEYYEIMRKSAKKAKVDMEFTTVSYSCDEEKLLITINL